MGAKIDYKVKLKQLYKPSARQPEIVEVPRLTFLMVDGSGDPTTSQAYKDAVEALFALAYAIKFMVKNGKPAIDYGVMPLEGQWWVDDMAKFSLTRRDEWKWTMMIMQPDPVMRTFVDVAIERVGQKKNLPALSRLRFEPFNEGKAAQILHLGPFSEEGPTIDRLHEFIREKGSRRRGKHHEIYLTDIRRADPRKWKTIIRQPMT